MAGLKILLLDSNQSFSKAARSFLISKKAVEAVEIAGDLEEALAIVDNFDPDYLIIDEAKILKGQTSSSLLCLLNEKLSGVKIITMVLYEECNSFALKIDQPGVVGRVSKQNFFTELPRLF